MIKLQFVELEKFNNIEESKTYFKKLKTLVKHNTINTLSKMILEKI